MWKSLPQLGFYDFYCNFGKDRKMEENDSDLGNNMDKSGIGQK
jgi:hypothetical protein